MSGTHGMPALGDDDFDAIAAAVAETARGRWFLAEYARRNRTADTNLLLDAIQRLAGGIEGDRKTFQIDQLRSDLLDMAKTIVRLKAEIAADGPDSHFAEAKGALDDVVKTTEAATSSILEATEQIQEMAWTLREAGADQSLCDLLDRRAGDIYTACTFQDLTAQRTQKVVRTLRYLEGRLNGLIDAWSHERPDATATQTAESLDFQTVEMQQAGPGSDPPAATRATTLSQDDIDIVIIEPDDSDDPLWLEDDVATRQESEEDLHAEGDITFTDLQQPQPPAESGEDEHLAGNHAEPPEQPQPVMPYADRQDGLTTLSAIDRLPTTAKLSLFG